MPHIHRAIEQAGMMMKVSAPTVLTADWAGAVGAAEGIVANHCCASFTFQQEQKKMPEAIQYIEKACMMYMENGTPDTAAMALDRAGK